MSKAAYMGVGGTARKVKKMYIGVNGVARKVKKAYIGVGGVARLFYSSALDFTNSVMDNGYNIPLDFSRDIGIINNRLICCELYHYGEDSDGDVTYEYSRNIAYSDDMGKSWTKIDFLPSNFGCYHTLVQTKSAILCVGFQYFPKSYDDFPAAVSYDGKNWTEIPINTIAHSAIGSAYDNISQWFIANDQFIAIRSMIINSNGYYVGNPLVVGVSSDGKTWTNKLASDMGLPVEYNSRREPGATVRFGTNGKYWFAFTESRYNSSKIYRSSTFDIFSTYTLLVDGTSTTEYRPYWAYNEDGSICIGSGSMLKEGCPHNYLSSASVDVSYDNGLTWKSVNVGADIFKLYYHDGVFFGISYRNNTLVWSEDGTNWSKKEFNISQYNYGTIVPLDGKLLTLTSRLHTITGI